jgi:predicted nucleic acid-binding protein
MKVVSNTSPLLFLSKVGRLSLLNDCFDRVYVPPAVIVETRSIPLGDDILVHDISPEGKGFVQGALGRLHRGELEAMRLALELGADLVLLDDLAARHKAQRMRLKMIGTIGVLLLANRRGVISAAEARDALDELIDRHNLYLSQSIRQQVMTELR